MPLYEYACLKCKRHTDKIEPVAGPHLKKCPHCGGKVESVITAPAIKFKGAGWYVNDYAAKTPAAEAKNDSKDSKDSSSKDSGGKNSKDSSSKDSSKESSSKDSSSKDTSSKESSSSKDSKEKKSTSKKD